MKEPDFREVVLKKDTIETDFMTFKLPFKEHEYIEFRELEMLKIEVELKQPTENNSTGFKPIDEYTKLSVGGYSLIRFRYPRLDKDEEILIALY